MKFIDRLATSDRGATSVEYGLIVALVFLAIIGSVSMVGDRAQAMWLHVATTVEAALG